MVKIEVITPQIRRRSHFSWLYSFHFPSIGFVLSPREYLCIVTFCHSDSHFKLHMKRMYVSESSNFSLNYTLDIVPSCYTSIISFILNCLGVVS